MLFVYIIGLVLFGASVCHVILASESSRLGGFSEALLKVAEFPSNIKDVLSSVALLSGQEIKNGRFGNLDGFKKDYQSLLKIGSFSDQNRTKVIIL